MPRQRPEISCAEHPPVPDTQHTSGPWRVGNLQVPTCPCRCECGLFNPGTCCFAGLTQDLHLVTALQHTPPRGFPWSPASFPSQVFLRWLLAWRPRPQSGSPCITPWRSFLFVCTWTETCSCSITHTTFFLLLWFLWPFHWGFGKKGGLYAKVHITTLN